MILFRKLHKWIGLAIGLQVAVWMLSGLVMGLLDHERVEGHHNKTKNVTLPLGAQSDHLLEASEVLKSFSGAAVVRGVQLVTFLGRPVYKVETADAVTLFSAADGSPVVIEKSIAEALGRRDYSGDGQVSAVTEVQAPSMEVRRHSGPVWRVDFNDEDETSLYVSGQHGAILERRNTSWRLFDVFWMLHIMDYQGREDFNNLLAIFASLIAAWFSITGITLFFDSFRLSDFLGLIPGHWWRKQAELSVCAPHGEVVTRISATAGGRLYDELAKGNIVLPSNCGGGGTCGLCVVNLEPSAPVSAADKIVIPEYQRLQGVRLSCQARAVDKLVVGVSEEVLAAECRTTEVVVARLVTPFMREITLSVDGGKFDYTAGSFVHVIIPPHEILYDDRIVQDSVVAVMKGVEMAAKSVGETEINRAYSLATAAEDNPGQIILNVRFMPPPAGTKGVPAGVGSSYMWNLRPGDQLRIVGPLGDFRAQDSDRDMIVIGGGAGMAPLRSIIRHDLLYRKSGRNIQFWYGARSTRELFYVEEFDELQDQFANFRWHAVLSEPKPSESWRGATGFVHLAVQSGFLERVQDSGAFNYYVCGPPAMLSATRNMLADHCVPESQIFFDDFGI